MKHKGKPQEKSIHFNQNKSRPVERDNLDNRRNEEQEFKADDITHNKKDHHNKQQNKRK